MKEKGFDKYLKGQTTTGKELSDSLPEVFTVMEDVKAEKATAQQDLYGELHFTKLPRWVSPIISEEAEHLCRPVTMNTGRTINISHSWGRYGE